MIMEVNSIIYCKNTGNPFRIRRLCFLNSIKHFELENIGSVSKTKLLAEESVKGSFELEKRTNNKSKIARFTELLSS